MIDIEGFDSRNVTREGIVVLPEQVWESTSKRDAGRKVTVLSVDDGVATLKGDKATTKVRVDRMYPHSKGFKIVSDPYAFTIEEAVTEAKMELTSAHLTTDYDEPVIMITARSVNALLKECAK